MEEYVYIIISELNPSKMGRNQASKPRHPGGASPENPFRKPFNHDFFLHCSPSSRFFPYEFSIFNMEAELFLCITQRRKRHSLYCER